MQYTFVTRLTFNTAFGNVEPTETERGTTVATGDELGGVGVIE